MRMLDPSLPLVRVERKNHHSQRQWQYRLPHYACYAVLRFAAADDFAPKSFLAMRPTICLNMIVKNERAAIRRCLESVIGEIDAWVIVDTGSTDGTQALIQEILGDVPGELHERPWKNFGHNRTEALRLAEGKADYLMFCDADMTLKVFEANWKQSLVADAYLVKQRTDTGFCYRNIRLVNARLTGEQRWRFWGATHEYCASVSLYHPNSEAQTDAIEFHDYADGGSKQDKFSRDVALLEGDLNTVEKLRHNCAKNPNSADLKESLAEYERLLPRTLFYLAQSYRDMGRSKLSLKTYQRRARMDGWAEEVWYSLYEVAKLSEQLKLRSEVIIERYLLAYQRRPQRAEPLVDLARYYREQGYYHLAHLFAERAIHIPVPDDLLFVDSGTYQWRSLDEYAVASYWIGHYRRCEQACKRLLDEGYLPHDQCARVIENQNFARNAIGETRTNIVTSVTFGDLDNAPSVRVRTQLADEKGPK